MERMLDGKSPLKIFTTKTCKTRASEAKQEIANISLSSKETVHCLGKQGFRYAHFGRIYSRYP
jgi:hypothetical protein